MGNPIVNRSSALAALLLAALALGGCGTTASRDALADAGPAGSPFTQQLFKNYSYLANSFGPATGGGFDTDGVATIFDTGGDTDTLAEAFATKALIASKGTDPDPEPSMDADSAGARSRLIQDLVAGKERYPIDAARAQTDFDCWMLNATVDSQRAASEVCHGSFLHSIARLEHAPPRLSEAPAAPPAPAAAPSANYTVYFDFDSWTLTGEALSTITDAVNAARAGRQSRITIVGHTDTAGAAGYNQRLSLKRADVV